MGPPSGRRRGLWALRGLIGALLLALMLRLVDWSALWALLVGLDPILLGVLILLKFITFGLSAVRWSVVLRADHITVPFMRLFRYHLIAWFFNSFLPPMIGADAVRVLALQESRSLGGKTAAVVLERALGLAAVCLLGLWALLSTANSQVQGLLTMSMAVMGAVSLAAVAAVLVPESWRRLVRPLAGRFSPRILAPFVDDFARAGRRYRRQRAMLAGAITLSAAIQVLVLGSFALRAHALNLPISAAQSMAAAAAVTLFITLPLTPGGIGSHEAGFALIYGAYGVGPTQALALALLSRGLDWAVAVVGGLLWLRPAQPSGTLPFVRH